MIILKGQGPHTTHYTELHKTFTKEKKKLVEKERQQKKAKYIYQF